MWADDPYSAVIRDGMLHVQAGGGIVADSQPEQEYRETLHKARGMIEGDIKVESLRHWPGELPAAFAAPGAVAGVLAADAGGDHG